jgi:phosphatidylglycerophosphate synthase
VTLAVLYASSGNALDPADAARLADELAAALRRAGASEVVRLTVGSEMTTLAADEPVLLCADDLVAHPSLLWTLATEPAGRSTALVVADPAGDLRDDRGRVVPAGDGPGTARFAGAIAIAPADRPVLTKAAEQARSADDLLPALLANGLVPVATPVRLLHAERVHTGTELAQARARVAAVDEDKARLRLAVKEKDDFFTTYAVSSWSPLVTKTAARLRLTPTAVTGLSVLFAVAAALCFWQASRPAMIVGGLLLYLGFVLDCVDGQLARYTRSFSTFGGWLDTMADRAKEYAVYAGLAAGAERVGLPYAWPLAITAILLQTVRHMTDTWYGALHDEATARPRPQAAAGVGARLSAASTRVQGDTGSVAYWLKRIVVFPIGERWALIALLAILTNGRVALIAVVGWGVLAFGYTLALRSLRALSMRVGVLGTVDTMRHRDDGLLTRRVLSRAGRPAPLAFAGLGAVTALALVVALLAGWLSRSDRWALAVAAIVVLGAGCAARDRHDGPLDWLVPAALRAGEYLLVVAVGLFGRTPPPVVFLLLFLLALRHYDLTARMEKGAPAATGGGARLGWDGRVLVLAVAGLAGVATLGEALLGAAVAGSFVDTIVRDRGSRA